MNIYYVFVLTSRNHRYLSVRATADLKFGVRHHRRAICRKLGKKKVYQKLVHLETFDSLAAAVSRERELKSWREPQLRQLISRRNPAWKPLSISAFLARPRKSVKTNQVTRHGWAT